jgi:hypothetical protein
MHNLDAALYKWICEAKERRDDLELPVGFIEESIAGLKGALGEQYLERLLIADSPAQYPPSAIEPATACMT